MFNQSLNSPGLICIDDKGSITLFNQIAGKLLNVDNNHLLFSSFESSFSDDFFGFSLKNFTQADQKCASCQIKVKDNTLFCHLEKDKDNRIIIVLNRSIPCLSLEEFDEMAHFISHEFRNPIGGIKGFASLLTRELSDKPDLLKWANFVLQGTENLNTLVSNFLEFSEPLKLELSSCEIKSVQQRLLENQGEEIKGSVLVNQENLNQAIDLLKHWLKTQGDKESEANICLTKEGSCLVIKVHKESLVLSDENLKKLFSPFKKQGDTPPISVAQKIILAHGGQVAVDSSEASGTIFSICLPMEKAVKKEVSGVN